MRRLTSLLFWIADIAAWPLLALAILSAAAWLSGFILAAFPAMLFGAPFLLVLLQAQREDPRNPRPENAYGFPKPPTIP